MIIAIDFDGTCVTHEYPNIGDDIGATPVLSELVAIGHGLILWTMRSSDCLQAAEAWFRTKEIPLIGVNCNPFQSSWTSSPKAYAHMYIDDMALGVPLVHPTEKDKKPFVDWSETRKLLTSMGVL